MENNVFQVNLQGMIDLLSHHLYGTPGVFVRELLQNAADAVRARERLDAAFAGSGQITAERYSSGTLAIHDNGIGLSEDDIRSFLSRIGSTSKRPDPDGPDDYMGQFGVGLLSCFVVSAEIVLITRAAAGGDPLEWRGRPDGTFDIRRLKRNVPVGTTVFLTGKEDYEDYFEGDRLYGLLRHYGAFLPVPIYWSEGRKSYPVNDPLPPWRMNRQQALDFGEEYLHERCLDVIPLSSPVGEVEGVAYILPYSVSPQAQKKHRVYLRGMLLSESVRDMLPPWAFFATCVIHTNSLRPTASRETFYENDMLHAVREELGACIKRHLTGLAVSDPLLFGKIVAIHTPSIKAMAVEDEELYALFIHHLTFETSMGVMTMHEILQAAPILHVTASLDEFRQVVRVAKAQDMVVVNGGYVHDFELVRRLGAVSGEVEVVVLDSETFTGRFQELDEEEASDAVPFLEVCSRVLQPFRCTPSIRWFEPADVPVLYHTNEELSFLRMADRGRDEINTLFAEVAEMIVSELYESSHARIIFNFNHPAVRKAVASPDPALQRLCAEMLYTQALLLGGYPLSQEELRLMSRSMMDFLNLGLARSEGSEGTRE